MDWLLHAIGLCPDHMTHPNLVMLAATGASGFFGFKFWIKQKVCKKDCRHDGGGKDQHENKQQ